MDYNKSEFLIETEVPQDELIISRTDLNGNITYVNDVFCKISGYKPEELLGKQHNIVRHPDMPSVVFKDLWETIKSKKQWTGVVKNMRKDGGYYWVQAIVSGVYNEGVLVEYKSLRTPISYAEKLKHQKLYDKIRQENGEKIRKIIYQ
ncbi:PAS domain-containing protein [Candidatus Sulfurimonas marisnigri]|uniref:PAS domain-containing protein n=1 Tax=Candidatus Sulfurimonas marisnigri TaxID=2740405 RepID=A0A7S7LZ70_9BACT|nr:PAS domain-containing protein [Candidatus Sulfurimonas marisnigri]QOY54141.1 PAS domain-containing protein [Candidatus Sulfurimonas marisnigri]